MINFKHNNIDYVIHPDDEGDYNLNEIHKMTQSPENRLPRYFNKLSNRAWDGKYKLKPLENRKFRGTFGNEEMTLGFLGYINATEVFVDGFEVEILRPERAVEPFAKKFIEALSKTYEVFAEFPVLGGKYYIDFYIPETNQAFEYDEYCHTRPHHIQADIIRQAEIEEALGCVFIRIPH